MTRKFIRAFICMVYIRYYKFYKGKPTRNTPPLPIQGVSYLRQQIFLRCRWRKTECWRIFDCHHSNLARNKPVNYLNLNWFKIFIIFQFFYSHWSICTMEVERNCQKYEALCSPTHKNSAAQMRWSHCRRSLCRMPSLSRDSQFLK